MARMISDTQELLHRAQAGKLNDKQLGEVAAALNDSSLHADAYTLLHVLALAKAKQYRALIERYLDCPDDPPLAKLALTTLCTTWGETEQYHAQVLAFLRGVQWDVARGGHVLLAATGIAGEYLRSSSQPDFIAELIDIYEKEDPLFQHAAYVALGRALGYAWHKILMRQIVETKLVDEAKTRLAKERE
jgi:hypothetical protein